MGKHFDAIRRWGSDRFHIQVSVDGLPERHDHTRGAGAFKTLAKNLELLRGAAFPFTASMCVDADNVDDMPGVVETAAELGAANEVSAARCCQRDVWLSLRKAAELSAVCLPVKLRAEGTLVCEQHRRNPNCATGSCPLWPGRG